ncbi:hypothetical protein O1611_g5677 [Lasiodiplodia mahajangana]|uniref:Uncharacterized protein n=1 Tax=Lasiodiplodia mahajangana TaxID=1108764 RepID=A0ACC2JKM5_9PEZI|nr:hypothetical protein O1611_g5677 [Lasiodiplodia mahajangana]
MATLTALPYSHKHYDSLLDVMDAANALATSGIVTNLTSCIGRIFIKHCVENVFGFVLLHRHFDMEPTEMLVAFGNVSVPWDVKCNKSELRCIAPISWRFTAEGIAPYEFTGEETTSLPHGPDYDEFARELGEILRDMHLEHLLGFCRIGGSTIESPATMEFTSGRANITVPDIMWALDEGHAAVEAAWQFGKQSKS